MRRRGRNPFSLFSFQDIITGLCGIMVFMVLVQAVDLVTGKDRVCQDELVVTDANQGLESIRREIVGLERKIVDVRNRAAKVVVVPKDRARPEEVEELTKAMTEKEKVVAALVSQVHDLETQVEKARNADAEDSAKVKEMERARRLLEQKLASQKGRKGLTLIPERGESKLPIYVVCAGSGIEVWRPFEKGCGSRRFGKHEVNDALADYFDGIDHTTHSVVLLVRPSGVEVMNGIGRLLKARSFTYGRDPLEEDVEIIFGEAAK